MIKLIKTLLTIVVVVLFAGLILYFAPIGTAIERGFVE